MTDSHTRDHGLDRRTFLGTAGAAAVSLLAANLPVGAARTAADQSGAGAATQSDPGRASSGLTRAASPNVVIVLADDMGYGDVACYDPEHSKIPTPHIDALAREGVRFTDAHTTSPVCSPSRYGLLTGRYHWRAGIRAALPKWAGPVIAPDRLTLPKLLKEQGYHTACIGKWHLGFDWPRTGGKLDFTKPLGGGPLAAGFDYYFGVDVPNFPPFTFIENDRITVQPTEHQTIDEEMIVNHEGPKAPGWKFDRIVPTLVEKGVKYIEERAASGQPFFLFFSLTSPHYPIAPSEKFRGTSGINALADFIVETDAALGAIAEALDRSGAGRDTLIIFTTDNGHDPVPGLEPFEQAGHRVSGPLSGRKFTIEEGGHRVPFVARWPAVVAPQTTCDTTICLTDLIRTCAEITGAELPDSAGEDSTGVLPLLRGAAERYQHPAIVHHAPDQSLAIRQHEWKLILTPATDDAARPVRLYNLRNDLGETRDVAADHPGIVHRLRAELERIVRSGRTTSGAPQKNDVEVHLPEP